MPSNQIKVCHISSLTQMGGVEKMLLEFLEFESERGSKIEHIIATTSSSVNVIKQFEMIGIKVFEPNRMFRFDPFPLIKLGMWLKQQKPDIIHTYNNVSNTWGTLSGLLSRGPIIITSEHGTAWDVQGIRLQIEKFFLKKAHCNLANSKASKHILEEKFDLPKNSVRVINNGIKMGIGTYNKNICRDEFGIDNEDFVIGTVGRIDYAKNQKALLEVAKIAKEKKLPFKFLIIGDGPLCNYLKIYIEKHDISSVVTLLGWRNDARDLLQLFDIYVSTSYRESFGNSLVEAALYKKPIIAPAIDGITDIFNESNAVLLKPTIPLKNQTLPGHKVPSFSVINNMLEEPKTLDPQDIFDNIVRLYEKPEIGINLSNKAYRHVLNNFDISDYAENLKTLYNELVLVRDN